MAACTFNKMPGMHLGNAALLLVPLMVGVHAVPLGSDAPESSASVRPLKHMFPLFLGKKHGKRVYTPPGKLNYAPDTVHLDRVESSSKATAKFLHSGSKNHTLIGSKGEPILTTVKYYVRWFNPKDMRFGASVNITFVEPMDFARHWQIRFRFKSTKVEVEEYWGSWNLTRLSYAHWYQLKPTSELRMDMQATTFFNFNAIAEGESAKGIAVDYPMQLAEWEIQLDQGPNKQPIVARLWESSTGQGGLLNVPMRKGLPTVPFGRFARANPELKPPIRLAEALHQPMHKIVESSKSRFSFIGMIMVWPILILLCLVLMYGALRSCLWRRNYRRQKRREELKWQMSKRPPPSRRLTTQEKVDSSDVVSKDWETLDEGYTLGIVSLYSGPQLQGTVPKEKMMPHMPAPIRTRSSTLGDDQAPPWPAVTSMGNQPSDAQAWMMPVTGPRTGRKMSAFYHNTLGKPSSPPPYTSSPPLLAPQQPPRSFSPKVSSPLSSSVVRRPSPPGVTGLGVANVIGSFADAAGLVLREEDEEGVDQESDIGGGGERWEYGGDLRKYASKKRQLRKLEMQQEASMPSGSLDEGDDKRDSLELTREKQSSQESPTETTLKRMSSSASKSSAAEDDDDEEDAPLTPVKDLAPSKVRAPPGKSCLKVCPSPVKKYVQWDETSFATRSKPKRMKRVTREEKAARLERKRREAQEKAQQEEKE